MKALLLLFLASPVLAAHKIDALSVKPSGQPSEVEVSISVVKSKADGNCEVRLDFGDGKGRTVDFGMATTRTLRYTYRSGGNYKVTAKGIGKTPCEGARETALNVKGPVEKKKAEEKKAEKKKPAEKKKADKKSAPQKKEEPK